MDLSINTPRRARPNPVVVGLVALAIGAGATAGAYQAFGSTAPARPATPHSVPPAKLKPASIGDEGCYATLAPQPC